MSPFYIGARAVIVVSEWPRNVGRVVILVGKYICRLRDDDGNILDQTFYPGWFVEDGQTFQGWEMKDGVTSRKIIFSERLGIQQWKLRPFVSGETVQESEEGIFYVETPTI